MEETLARTLTSRNIFFEIVVSQENWKGVDDMVEEYLVASTIDGEGLCLPRDVIIFGSSTVSANIWRYIVDEKYIPTTRRFHAKLS